MLASRDGQQQAGLAYRLGVHKDGGAFRTRHHHFQRAFKLGTDALQTLTKKAHSFVRYLPKLSLDRLRGKAREKFSVL